MRVVAISDTHCGHHELDLPEGDMLVHAGDFLGWGTAPELDSFIAWLDAQPFEHKVVVPGNHDRIIEQSPLAEKLLARHCTLLIDRVVMIRGFKIYGMPWTPRYLDWSFYHDRESPEMLAVVDRIPKNLDLLITHGPPYGTADATRRAGSVGCEVLDARLRGMAEYGHEPRHHVFGHIHECAGEHDRVYGRCVSRNVACLSKSYDVIGSGTVFDLEKR